MNVQPYLFFDGRCEEALEFYRAALGAEIVMMMRNSESPDGTMCVEGAEQKILHSAFRVGETTICASDGHSLGQPEFRGFGLSITVATESEADRMFAALSEGGQTVMPMNKTFFSPRFGMLTDRFGVMWMILVAE